MRIIGYLILVIAVAAYSGCKETLPEKVVVEVPALRASSILNYDSVTAYRSNYAVKNEAVAASYYLRGEQMIKADLKQAIYLIKRAITLNPTEEAYKVLGKSLINAGMYREAYRLYYFLQEGYHNDQREQYVFGKPDMDVYYGKMLAYYLQYGKIDMEDIWNIRELKLDIGEFKDRFLSDPHTHFDTTSIAYKSMLMKFVPDEELEKFKDSDVTFRSMVSSIKDSSAAFEIDQKTVRQFRFDNVDHGESDYYNGPDLSNYYIYCLLEKKTDPESYYDFNLNHKMYINDSVVAIVYAIDNSPIACPLEMRQIYHRLVTYTRNGKMIDNEIVAEHDGYKLSTVKFNGNSFVISTFERKWKKPYDRKDFDNEVIKTEPLDTKPFIIKPNGEIESMSS